MAKKRKKKKKVDIDTIRNKTSEVAGGLEDFYGFLKEIYYSSSAPLGNRILLNMFKTNRKKLLIRVGAAVLVAIILAGMFWETIFIIRGYVTGYSIFWILYYGFKKFWFPAFEILLFFLFCYYKLIEKLDKAGILKKKRRKRKKKASTSVKDLEDVVEG